MSWLIGCASVMAAGYFVLIHHPLENNIFQTICCFILPVTSPILLVIAEYREDKMEKRIAALEKEVVRIRKGGAE